MKVYINTELENPVQDQEQYDFVQDESQIVSL